METSNEEEHSGEDSWGDDYKKGIANNEVRREINELKLKKICVEKKIAYQGIDILKDFKCKLNSKQKLN